MNNKRLLYRIVALVIVLAIAATMFVIGRGHTIYLDSKELEYEGQTVKCPYKISVYVNDESVAKLYAKERGSTTCIGQSFKMELAVMQEKGGTETRQLVELKLPYNMDGIIINLPALLAGLPTEAYLSEFVQIEEVVEEEVVTDEFGGEGFDIQSDF